MSDSKFHALYRVSFVPFTWPCHSNLLGKYRNESSTKHLKSLLQQCPANPCSGLASRTFRGKNRGITKSSFLLLHSLNLVRFGVKYSLFLLSAFSPRDLTVVEGPEMTNVLAMHTALREKERDLGVSTLPNWVLQAEEQRRVQSKTLK